MKLVSAFRQGAGRQRGLSIVELLVGVAVGLFVVAGAVTLTVNSLGSNRQMLLETRLNQDMRAVADIIARDLRRASYWDDALSGLWSAGAPVVSAVNPYAAIASAPTSVGFDYERTGIAVGAEPHGFRRVVNVAGHGVIEVQNDGVDNWEAITDASSMDVVAFAVTPTQRAVELWQFCSCRTRIPVVAECVDATLSTSGTRPQMLIRQFDIEIRAQSLVDATVRRELRESIRVRNDELRNPNGCPGT